jgi:hypothetical protein
MCDDRQCRQDKLQLHVLIQVVEPCDIWRPVTHDQIRVVSFELSNDGG